jgi:hypothetical protein
MKKFLIGQLACFGDCLYATTIAKQIKNDFPDAHITWAISTKYKAAIFNNPHIDSIWEIDIKNNDFYDINWDIFVKEAKEKQKQGVFDELIFSQIPKANWHNFDGMIRSSILNNYQKPINVDIRPIIRLTTEEVNNVKKFIEQNNINQYKNVILFECAPGTGQSFVNINLAIHIAQNITKEFKDTCFVLSSPQKISANNPQIADASTLTFRENAELANYANLMIGCSSGITWLSTSDWVNKKLKTLQLLTNNYGLYAGMEYEHNYWGVNTDHIIEMADVQQLEVEKCIKEILTQDFNKVKTKFHQIIKPNYQHFEFALKELLAFTRNKKSVLQLVNQFYKKNKHLSYRKILAIALKIRKPKWYHFLSFMKVLPKI